MEGCSNQLDLLGREMNLLSWELDRYTITKSLLLLITACRTPVVHPGQCDLEGPDCQREEDGADAGQENCWTSFGE